MSGRRYNIPSISSLTAFEAVARLQGFARAAAELHTSQPAISRHIRNLESRFGAELFDRDQTPIGLTPKGSQFYASVVQGFDALQAAVQDLRIPDNKVTLVCSHSVSHLLLMPRYRHLKQALGADVELRVMTAEYNLVDAAVETGADIVFEYTDTPPDTDYVVVCDEEIKPVGTAEIVAQAVDALARRDEPPALLALQKENYGWMDWSDWQRAHPEYSGWPVSEAFDSYVYLLEAAASGAGLALGWRRFVDAHLRRGDLVEMPAPWHSQSTRVIARLSDRFGRANPIARRCLTLLAAED